MLESLFFVSIRISFFDLVVSESWGRSCVLGDTFLADLEIELKQEKKKQWVKVKAKEKPFVFGIPSHHSATCNNDVLWLYFNIIVCYWDLGEQDLDPVQNTSDLHRGAIAPQQLTLIFIF